MAFCNRGNMRRLKKDYAAALEDLNQAIVLNPLLAEAYANRGFVKASSGQLTAALEDFREALRVAAPRWRFRTYVENWLERCERMLEERR